MRRNNIFKLFFTFNCTASFLNFLTLASSFTFKSNFYPYCTWTFLAQFIYPKVLALKWQTWCSSRTSLYKLIQGEKLIWWRHGDQKKKSYVKTMIGGRHEDCVLMKSLESKITSYLCRISWYRYDVKIFIQIKRFIFTEILSLMLLKIIYMWNWIVKKLIKIWIKKKKMKMSVKWFWVHIAVKCSKSLNNR